jgi:hypothetical protein
VVWSSKSNRSELNEKEGPAAMPGLSSGRNLAKVRAWFDDGDLGDALFADLDLRHCNLLFAALSIDLPKHDV